MRILIFLFIIISLIILVNAQVVGVIIGEEGGAGGIGGVSVTTKLNHLYAGMWYKNNTGTILPFVAPNVYYTLFFPNATDLRGFTHEGDFGTDSNLTAKYDGVYQATYMAVGSGLNNHLYRTSVFVNDIEKPECGNSHKMSAGGDIITQSGNCFITLYAGDVVKLKTADIDATGNGVYYSGNLNLLRVNLD